jgi:integrase
LEPALDAHIAWLRETKPPGWDGRRLFPSAAGDQPSAVGAYLDPGNFYRSVWNPACTQLGIKDLSFHSMRHTFASTALMRGASPTEVAAWLGDTVAVVMRHYAHVIKGLEQDRAGLLTPAAPAASTRSALRRVK